MSDQVECVDMSIHEGYDGYCAGHGQHEGQGRGHTTRQHQVQGIALELLRLSRRR